ncbi:MAG: alanine dehydrogenase [Bifidobacteriaceae bacterium]|nr:alanine dehydrogenase [Bifidobacteriaceae bacterium]
MRIGVPSEVKNNERRVALTAGGAEELVSRGHEVWVQHGAGDGSGFPDARYLAAGAKIAETAEEAWGRAELVLKVKDPVPAEYGFLRPDLTLFTYLHLAADRELTDALLASGTTAIAYETVQTRDGALPLLAPMSEIAGRLSAIVGAFFLTGPQGGLGRLPGGIPGVGAANVVVIGGGVAGEHAAANAAGLGADVTVMDVSIPRLRQLAVQFGGRVATRASNPATIARKLRDADLVIGSVLIPGARAPKLVTDDMVATMRPGSVLVDIAIDQGGCFEGSRPTTHAEPIFHVHGSTYYCVANMPGAVPETATRALSNSTLPYVVRLADGGWHAATASDPALAKGLNIHAGAVYNAAVADAFGLPLAG